MNVREEDRQKNACPSRGLGVAAAAIGVGVGAALYYFFSKRSENPHTEGSTSDWTCERPDTFHPFIDDMEDSYTTISEHETTDTSINETVTTANSFSSDSSSHYTSDNESHSLSDVEETFYDSDNIYNNNMFDYNSHIAAETGYFTSHVESGSESDVGTEWDITSSSVGVPESEVANSLRTLVANIGNYISPNRFQSTEEEQMAILRDQAFRERSWTLEECSICFDVMLRGQEVMTLPCTHNFHTPCILPWLQEKQTCPVCRKSAE